MLGSERVWFCMLDSDCAPVGVTEICLLKIVNRKCLGSFVVIPTTLRLRYRTTFHATSNFCLTKSTFRVTPV